MTRDQFVRVFFIALLIFVAYQVLLILMNFYRAIFWAGTLTFAFYPLYQKIRKAMPKYETFSAILMTAIIFLVVIPPCIYLIFNLTTQAIGVYQNALDYVRSGSLEKLIDHVRSTHFIQRIEEHLGGWEIIRKNLETWLLTSSRSIGNFAAGQLGSLTKNIFSLVLNLFLMCFLIFIFLKDGEKIYQFLYQIAPLEERNKRPIFRQVNDTFSAVIRGQLLTALTQATVAGFAFWLLGLPLPVFFAALTFFASLIPVVGSSAVWLPLAIYLVTINAYIKAVILFVIGAFVISLIDNIMKPALIGEKTKLPYFLLFFGMLGGIKVYGFTGIFITPVILSLFFSLVKIYQEKNW